MQINTNASNYTQQYQEVTTPSDTQESNTTSFIEDLDDDSVTISQEAVAAASTSTGTGGSTEFPTGGSGGSGIPTDETGS